MKFILFDNYDPRNSVFGITSGSIIGVPNGKLSLLDIDVILKHVQTYNTLEDMYYSIESRILKNGKCVYDIKIKHHHNEDEFLIKCVEIK